MIVVPSISNNFIPSGSSVDVCRSVKQLNVLLGGLLMFMLVKHSLSETYELTNMVAIMKFKMESYIGVALF